MEREGEDVGEGGDADLILTEATSAPVVREGKTIGPGIAMTEDMLAGVGVNLEEGESGPRYVLGRWYDVDEGWHDQVLASIPLSHLWSGGLGPARPAGIVVRAVSPDQIDHIFGDGLSHFLKELKYTGFISLIMKGNSLVGVRIKPISMLWFAAMEALDGRMASFMATGKGFFHSTWTVALLFSRYPYPFKEEDARTHLTGIYPGVEKHFWPFDLTVFKKAAFTSATRIGVVTSWGPDLRTANARALHTCESVGLEQKQYRVDAAEVAGRVWAQVKGFLVG